MVLTRREFIGAVAAGVAVAPAIERRATLRFIALGQSLILRDLAAQKLPGYADLRARLKNADIVFSNLEVAIAPGGLRSEALVVADPLVLDSLADLSINLLSLANNHADDGGAEGFLRTIAEARRRGFAVAGTGATLAEASAAGYLSTKVGTAGLVAMASNAVPQEAMALPDRAGVNHLMVRGSAVDRDDADRVLGAITTAAKKAEWVFVYHHDHFWARDWQETPDWKKAWCRACIDAGATAFISHGVPILHGIEIYKGRPIFYGIGNFVFHLNHHLPRGVPAPYTDPRCWESVIAHCEFDGRQLRSLRVDPIDLRSDRGVGEGNFTLHGNPQLAEGKVAAGILERLRTLSRAVGTEIEIVGQSGFVRNLHELHSYM
jgi:poly-gamma-glutamate synthesis protein (capsule biosynthesis protein)